MQTTKNATATTARKTKPTSTVAKKEDAILLLKEDHTQVKKLFKEFEKLSKKEDEGKVEIANQICMELIVHAQVEEEIFYTAARMAIDDDDMLNEAEVEHDTAKDLIAQIQTMDPEDEMYDAKVTVLGEYITHHVEEEESEMFPKARKAKMDLEELGMQMSMRKEELISKLSPAGEIDTEALKQQAIEAASKH